MARKTDGVDVKTHFQMDRYVQQNSEWFYITREGDEHGPFDSKEDAKGDLTAFIRHRLNMEEFGQ